MLKRRTRNNSEPPLVSVYDGRTFLGRIFDQGGVAGYECLDRDGTLLGFFSDQRAALDAFDPLIVGDDAPHSENSERYHEDRSNRLRDAWSSQPGDRGGVALRARSAHRG